MTEPTPALIELVRLNTCDIFQWDPETALASLPERIQAILNGIESGQIPCPDIATLKDAFSATYPVMEEGFRDRVFQILGSFEDQLAEIPIPLVEAAEEEETYNPPEIKGKVDLTRVSGLNKEHTRIMEAFDQFYGIADNTKGQGPIWEERQRLNELFEHHAGIYFDDTFFLLVHLPTKEEKARYIRDHRDETVDFRDRCGKQIVDLGMMALQRKKIWNDQLAKFEGFIGQRGKSPSETMKHKLDCIHLIIRTLNELISQSEELAAALGLRRAAKVSVDGGVEAGSSNVIEVDFSKKASNGN